MKPESSKMEPESSEIVLPEPYFKIKFGCSNRAFYGVKSELYDIAEKIGIEIEDGYIDEQCDYEGDLEKIIIYAEERSSELIQAVLAFYEVPAVDVPDGMNVALSIF